MIYRMDELTSLAYLQERAKIARKSIEDELESLRSQRRDMEFVGGEQKVTEVRQPRLQFIA